MSSWRSRRPRRPISCASLIRLATTPSAGRRLLPAGAALASLAFIVAGSLMAGFDASHPRPTSILYALDADTGRAIFATFDAEPDPWTAAFLPATPDRGTFAEFFPPAEEPVLTGPAPVVPLAAPVVERGYPDGASAADLAPASAQPARSCGRAG